MHGDKKHSSRRFTRSAERKEEFSASNNSVTSTSEKASRVRSRAEIKSKRKDEPPSKPSEKKFNDIVGKIGNPSRSQESVSFSGDYDSSGESVSSSEADEDVDDFKEEMSGSSGDEDLVGEKVQESHVSRRNLQKVSAKLDSTDGKKYNKRPPSNGTDKSNGRKQSNKTSKNNKKKAISEGRGRTTEKEIPKKSSESSASRKKTPSPGGIYKDASVGFFDLYARHLNASKATYTQNEQGSGYSHANMSKGLPPTSPHSTKVHVRGSPSPVRGFGAVRHMSPAERAEYGQNIPPSINSALPHEGHRKGGPLTRLRTPDDLSNKRPSNRSAGKSPNSGSRASGGSVESTPAVIDQAEWSRLLSWLNKIGMEKYAVRFRKAGINKLSVVELLRSQDLRTMQVDNRDIPIIMESIREISRRTLSYAESVASPSISPSSSFHQSPRGGTPVLQNQYSQQSSDILSSLSKRLTQRRGDAQRIAKNSPRSPTVPAGPPSIEMLIRAFDMGHDSAFLRQWGSLRSILGDIGEGHEFLTLDFYCRLYFAIRPALAKLSKEKISSSMYNFKQYLEGFVNSTRRTPAQQMLINSRLFAAYAGIVMVPDPLSNPAYSSLFDPKWRQGLRTKVSSFLHSLQQFPRVWSKLGMNVHTVEPPSSKVPNDSGEKELIQALDTLEASQTTLAASEKLNNALMPEGVLNSSPTTAAIAKQQYRATIPQNYSQASNSTSQSNKISLKPRDSSSKSKMNAQGLQPRRALSPHTGYLQKRVRKGWKNRYFHLNSRSLTYYLNDTMGDKKGELVLTNKCSFLRLPDVEEHGQCKQYCFQLTDSAFDRTMMLAAADEAKFEAWETHLRSALEAVGGTVIVNEPLPNHDGGNGIDDNDNTSVIQVVKTDNYPASSRHPSTNKSDINCIDEGNESNSVCENEVHEVNENLTIPVKQSESQVCDVGDSMSTDIDSTSKIEDDADEKCKDMEQVTPTVDNVMTSVDGDEEAESSTRVNMNEILLEDKCSE